MLSNRFRFLTFIGGAALCLTSAGLSGCSKQVEKPKGRPPALVMVAPATQANVPLLIKAIGNMEASESVAIRSQISGELTSVAFREGQEVQKGALLFQLDARSYQAALKKSEASLTRNQTILSNAGKDYLRYSQLVKDGIVTQEQAEGYRTRAESAEADVVADKAAVESARTQLSYCTITAPISGRLGALMIDRGNVVKANETVLVTINKLTPINASFSISGKELEALKRQMSSGRISVAAELPEATSTSVQGVVSFIDNTIDPGTGTIRVKALFENRKKLLWPGQFVNLSMTLAVLNNAVVVPSQAIQTGQKGLFVFVVLPDGTAEIRPVSVGPVSGGMTVIEKGVQPGDQVVIDGQMRVLPGGKVEIKGAEKPGGEGKVGAASTDKGTSPGAAPK